MDNSPNLSFLSKRLTNVRLAGSPYHKRRNRSARTRFTSDTELLVTKALGRPFGRRSETSVYIPRIPLEKLNSNSRQNRASYSQLSIDLSFQDENDDDDTATSDESVEEDSSDSDDDMKVSPRYDQNSRPRAQTLSSVAHNKPWKSQSCSALPSRPLSLHAFKRDYTLPTLAGSDIGGIPRIESSTLKQLLLGKFADQVHKYVIIDARFPFEYNGGHIKGAVNIENIRDVRTFLSAITNKRFTEESGAEPEESVIVIFHCEFSSHRGPKLCQMFRNWDRNLNMDRYPSTFFPDTYILEGGYKQFWTDYPGLCTPRAYIPMKHPDYMEELRVCMIKARKETNVRSRSWSHSQFTRPTSMNILRPPLRRTRQDELFLTSRRL